MHKQMHELIVVYYTFLHIEYDRQQDLSSIHLAVEPMSFPCKRIQQFMDLLPSDFNWLHYSLQFLHTLRSRAQLINQVNLSCSGDFFAGALLLSKSLTLIHMYMGQSIVAASCNKSEQTLYCIPSKLVSFRMTIFRIISFRLGCGRTYCCMKQYQTSIPRMKVG